MKLLLFRRGLDLGAAVRLKSSYKVKLVPRKLSQSIAKGAVRKKDIN